MAVLPIDKTKRIAFCESHIAIWAADPSGIGTTPEAVSDLTAKTVATRNAYKAQKMAQAAAQAATLGYHIALRDMTQAAQTIVDQVRVKARAVGDEVYPLAQIPSPAAPSPTGTLGMPNRFNVALDESGALTLSWKCTNPRGATGTFYQIWRRIASADNAGAFQFLGGVGEKKYTDHTVPPGSAVVEYRVQAMRSTGVGPMALYIVNLGGGMSGAMAAGFRESGRRAA